MSVQTLIKRVWYVRHMLVQVRCKRHKGMIFTFKKNSLMEKADPDLQSTSCLSISPMGSRAWRQKSVFLYVQHKAEHTVDAQGIALELESAQKNSSWETCLHKVTAMLLGLHWAASFMEVMVKVKGIHLYLEKLKDNSPIISYPASFFNFHSMKSKIHAPTVWVVKIQERKGVGARNTFKQEVMKTLLKITINIKIG